MGKIAEYILKITGGLVAISESEEAEIINLAEDKMRGKVQVECFKYDAQKEMYCDRPFLTQILEESLVRFVYHKEKAFGDMKTYKFVISDGHGAVRIFYSLSVDPFIINKKLYE